MKNIPKIAIPIVSDWIALPWKYDGSSKSAFYQKKKKLFMDFQDSKNPLFPMNLLKYAHIF